MTSFRTAGCAGLLLLRSALRVCARAPEPGPAQVGNGEFAYGCDVTGMQTLGTQFSTRSNWAGAAYATDIDSPVRPFDLWTGIENAFRIDGQQVTVITTGDPWSDIVAAMLVDGQWQHQPPEAASVCIVAGERIGR